MRWMEIAWAEVGVTETAGPDATPAIVGYFRDAGRGDVVSDEVAWCAGFLAACLSRGGVSVASIDVRERLRARAYATFGTALPVDAPRVGAIAVLSRGNDPSQGHVGFVAGWSEDTIALLGGNQADSVNVSHFPRKRIVALRWPAPEATAADLSRAGSTSIKRSGRQVTDAGKTGLLQYLPDLPAKAPLPSPDALVAKGSALQGTVEAAIGFAVFAREKWPWVIGAATAYFVARMAWDAYAIRQARLADHNTGANTARSTTETDDAAQ